MLYILNGYVRMEYLIHFLYFLCYLPVLYVIVQLVQDNNINNTGGAPVGVNAILGGLNNAICGNTVFSGIGAGGQNVIENGYVNFIGGGDHNHIISPTGTSTQISRSFIGGGIGNYIFEQCSSIVGGSQNTINAGGVGSFIAGGDTNTIYGACSSILGGSGNNDGGLNNVIIAGSGITAVNPNTLHVNGLWANGVPNAGAGPFPQGTVFWLPAGAPLPFPPLPTTG